MNKDISILQLSYGNYVSLEDYMELKKQLDEKDKVIDKAKKYCKAKTKFNCFGDTLTEKVLDTYVTATKKDILEILERGKNEIKEGEIK